MRAPLRLLLPVLVLGLVVPPAAHAADKPAAKALYKDGPEGRYLLDGQWLFRLDNADQGVKDRFMRQTSSSGWIKTTVPNVWNLSDPTNESMAGGIGWYRKDFLLPSADLRLAWAFRFESVDYRAKVWLNGTPLGENTGAYIPFEMVAKALKRKGTNRLVVRVDSRRKITDFPPAGLNADGVPTGGWWNYSGIQREVYLRKLDTMDFQKVLVRPVIDCATCPASVQAEINLKNVTKSGERATITGKYGNDKLDLGTKTVPANGIVEFSDTLHIEKPRLWSPSDPQLYDVSFTVRVDGKKVAGYSLHSGIRSIKVVNGRLLINGQYMNLRGVGLHEDSKAQGF